MATSFRIVPKRDFGSGKGFWVAGAGETGTGRFGFVKHGFVVTDGCCNIMPGATWFRTVSEAIEALDILCSVNFDADLFWQKIQKPEQYYLQKGIGMGDADCVTGN